MHVIPQKKYYPNSFQNSLFEWRNWKYVKTFDELNKIFVGKLLFGVWSIKSHGQ